MVKNVGRHQGITKTHKKLSTNSNDKRDERRENGKSLKVVSFNRAKPV